MRIFELATAAAALLAAAAAAAPDRAEARTAPAPETCASLAGKVAGLTVASAKAVAADTAANAPAYCELAGTISPEAGSRIGVVYRLPLDWNGKIVGLGGGGWAGNVTLNVALPPLRKGYATLQTDGGHPSPNGTDATWALTAPGVLNQPGITDFSWRAVHEMTVKGKDLVRAFYGQPQDRAYFQGCSTGGRMGLMEVQRFPDDYDGVTAGAPVYDLRVQTSALMRVRYFHQDPESNLLPAQVPTINKAVLAACDKLDGAADGIVSQPLACKWDPKALQCPAGTEASATCLSPKQVATVRNAYAGTRTRAGKTAAFPLMRGGEMDWLARSVGDAQAPLGGNMATGARAIQYFVYADPNYDINAWNPDADWDKVEGGAFAATYEAKNPDITAFARKGGKLILWHGGYDPGPSPLGTTEYYEAASKALGPKSAESMRFFIVPGVYHCQGGPGPDQFDALGALDRWVEQGTAPQSISATNRQSKLTRPLCPFPEKAAYLGGDPMVEASFQCRK